MNKDQDKIEQALSQITEEPQNLPSVNEQEQEQEVNQDPQHNQTQEN